MDHVSLLPPEVKEAKIAKRRQNLLLLLFMIAMLTVITVNTYYFVSSLVVRDNLKSLQQERAVVEKQAADLIEYSELSEERNRLKKPLSDAMGTVPLWHLLLRDIGQTLPVGTQLSNLSMNYAGESGSVNMLGWAYGYSGVADMLDQLFTVEQLDRVESRVYSETDRGGGEVVRFEVVSLLLTGSEFFPEDQDGD